jgi:hypothetical protein
MRSQKLIASVGSILPIVTLIVASVFISPLSTANASGDAALAPQIQLTNKPTDVGKQPTKETGKPDDKGNDKESGLYKRAETAVRENQQHIDLANKVVTKTQEWMDEIKSTGKSVTTLQTALTAFKAEIAVAQKANDDARKTLQSPSGFDSGGQVKDRDQAHQTVLKLSKDLRDVKKALDKATQDFRRAVADARQTLKGDNAKTPEPTKKP